MTQAFKPRAIHQLTAWFAALAVLLAPLVAVAQPVDTMAEARQRYQAGKQLFDSGDYQGAIQEFEAANRLAPAPTLHFNIGLAHERLGQREEALTHFRAYLQKQPNASNRELVEIKISRLESELGITSTAPPPPAATTAPPPAPTGAATPPSPAVSPAPAPNTSAATTTTPPAPDGTTPPPMAATGDPMLDRVASINVASVRDQRAPLMADMSASSQAVEAEAAPSEPAYKSVWFWIVVGVSSLILLDVAFGG
ncbi:MAG: hypothetical protein Tsb0020_50790 [Haliangiales bacterium]